MPDQILHGLTLQRTALAIGAALILSACGDHASPPKQATPVLTSMARAAAARLDAPSAPLSPMALLGRKLFFDTSLSASGRMSCASCHDPAHAYAPANALAVQLGGPDLQFQGSRAVPTLTYLERTPHFVVGPDPKAEPGESGPPKAAKLAGAATQGMPDISRITSVVPQGGMDWDGRANTLPDQAAGPLFDPREMANRDAPSLLAKLKAAPYAGEFATVFGNDAFATPDIGGHNAGLALARFQIEDRSFHAYDSKFDYYLAGRVQLSEQEQRGLALFDDPKKGNCAACHTDRPSKNRFAPVFTDYQFEALAVPRNRDLAANREPSYYDEGLCGPARHDMAAQANYCGLFKTPTLRNVATRKVFFHNGVFHTLEDTVRFYVERETRPEEWYPQERDGTLRLYDDLPAAHRGNVDVADAPFNRHRGEQPALNAQEIADVVAFLQTLNDGYKVAK